MNNSRPTTPGEFRALEWQAEAQRLKSAALPGSLDTANDAPGNWGGGQKRARLLLARRSTSEPVRRALQAGDSEPNDIFKWGHYNEAIGLDEMHTSGVFQLSAGQTPTDVSAMYHRPFNSHEHVRYSQQERDRFSRKADGITTRQGSGQTSYLEIKSGRNVPDRDVDEIHDYAHSNPNKGRHLTLMSMSTYRETEPKLFELGRKVQGDFSRQREQAIDQRLGRNQNINQAVRGLQTRQVFARSDDMPQGHVAPIKLMPYALARNPEPLNEMIKGHLIQSQQMERDEMIKGQLIQSQQMERGQANTEYFKKWIGFKRLQPMPLAQNAAFQLARKNSKL
ncbi:hypothetical protein ACLBKS_03210 [Hylemonella sp. W303a]|uniref:hypothetical protein n=1 Tax=Hylemonella sp. W303a TaxID=3389873 RepID=UPI00396B3F50